MNKEKIKKIYELSHLPIPEIASKLRINQSEVKRVLTPFETDKAPSVDNAIDILEQQAKKDIESLSYEPCFESQLVLKDFISYFIENKQVEINTIDFEERLLNPLEEPRLTLSNITGLDNNRINAIARLAIVDYLREKCANEYDLEN